MMPFFSPVSTTAQLFGIIAAKETVTNLSGSTRAACVLFLMTVIDKLLVNINRPSLYNRRIHDMLTLLTLVYKSFHGLAPCYINDLLLERNSSYNLGGKHSLSHFPEFNRPNMVCTPFATLCQQILEYTPRGT